MDRHVTSRSKCRNDASDPEKHLWPAAFALLSDRSVVGERYNMNTYQRFAVLVIGLTQIALNGCAERLNQFNTFAQAGTTYVTASQSVIQAAGTATVNTDSALLMKYRSDLDETQRRERVTKSDTLLKERLHVLQLISAHGKLLQQYFEALASLSDPKATNTVGTAAQGVYDSLAKISPELKNARMGGTSVSSFIPTVISPIVATFKAHALNEELKARASAIVNEIALQEAAFSAIAAELKTDAQVQQNLKETDSIDEFVAGASLPTDWAAQRLAILSAPPAVASADAASKAAAQLRSAFSALVENRPDSTGFTSLMNDVSNMLTITQSIQGAVE